MPPVVLIDVDQGIWVDAFSVSTPNGMSVAKGTLRGGLGDGVDLIEVCNGALSFSILPTRGMGLWRGDYKGTPLGWSAPVRGPVHPKFVDLQDRGGIGWLQGFDEWMCRCGLASNGPPGRDGDTDLTLHGRIANQPAHRVDVDVGEQDPFKITVSGEVEEGGLFYPRLRLSTVYSTHLNSNRITINDTVTNMGSRPAEMQLLYHCNFGPPLLAEGSRVHVPIREVTPMTEKARHGIQRFPFYGPPTSGFVEEVLAIHPVADDGGNTLVMLSDPTGTTGVALRWNVRDLPCLSVWKNTGAIEDGYVTGIEPATNFPRFKSAERESGRVVLLPPAGTWHSTWSVEVHDNPTDVKAVIQEIDDLQSSVKPVYHDAWK